MIGSGIPFPKVVIGEIDMKKAVTFAICGFGSRGCDAYAVYQRRFPEEMKIVAVADPRDSQRQIAVDTYQVPAENCFASGEELLKQPKLADVMIIATQDQDHYRYAIPALEKGYHLLLEKPISPDLAECIQIREKAKECGRIVMVCHVLRYAPFHATIHSLIQQGEIGRVENISAAENIGFEHFCHSFVRGNWRNSTESSPIVLAKTCHDMDILRWLVGKPCKRVSSFGSLDWFRAENAPEGSAERCVNCPVGSDCPANAEAMYLRNFRENGPGWPCNVLTGGVPTEETLREALEKGPYGRCVFHCDNDVADHQTVHMEFEGGVTASFYLSAFSNVTHRTICVQGTLGEIWGDSDENCIHIRRYGEQTRTIPLTADTGNFSGHGGGDAGMMRQLCRMIAENDSKALTGIEASVESHVMALAAEESRVNGGLPIELDAFMKSVM